MEGERKGANVRGRNELGNANCVGLHMGITLFDLVRPRITRRHAVGRVSIF